VTTDGEGQKNVCWPDGADDCSTGVVGCKIGHDVDTAYAVGEMVPVYMTGSMAVVWVRYVANGGALGAGYFVSNTGAGANGLGTLGTEGTYELLGRCTHFHANVAGSEQWVKVRLGV
jgi:hypothetical protein